MGGVNFQKISIGLCSALIEGLKIARARKHEEMSSEHFLLAALEDKRFVAELEKTGNDAEVLRDVLNERLKDVPGGFENTEVSKTIEEVFARLQGATEKVEYADVIQELIGK